MSLYLKVKLLLLFHIWPLLEEDVVLEAEEDIVDVDLVAVEDSEVDREADLGEAVDLEEAEEEASEVDMIEKATEEKEKIMDEADIIEVEDMKVMEEDLVIGDQEDQEEEEEKRRLSLI